MLGIVTISFNQVKFLSEAIDSVVKSIASEHFKYVIVDAGSTDGSQEVIKSRYNDFHAVIFEPDRGPADGLNKGFKSCSNCEILGYINADDRFVSGALSWVLNYFEKNPNIDVLLGGVGIIDASGRRARRARVSDMFNLRRYLIGACNVFQQGTFFRRAAFERTTGFNIENRTCWDAELMVDMALAGATFDRSQRILGEFRIHESSITGSQRLSARYVQDRIRIANKIRASGIQPYSTWQANIVRTVHRLNPLRQLSYLLAS